MQDETARERLALLLVEHRDLDAALAAMIEARATDQLRLARMKRRKLALRDEIVVLQNQLLPDIIA